MINEKKLRLIQKETDLNDEYKDRIKQLENELKGKSNERERGITMGVGFRATYQ